MPTQPPVGEQGAQPANLDRLGRRRTALLPVRRLWLQYDQLAQPKPGQQADNDEAQQNLRRYLGELLLRRARLDAGRQQVDGEIDSDTNQRADDGIEGSHLLAPR